MVPIVCLSALQPHARSEGQTALGGRTERAIKSEAAIAHRSYTETDVGLVLTISTPALLDSRRPHTGPAAPKEVEVAIVRPTTKGRCSDESDPY